MQNCQNCGVNNTITVNKRSRNEPLGHVHLFDVRREDKPVWTLSAHSDGVNGLVLSPQCPDCLITVSSDETMKVALPVSPQYCSNCHATPIPGTTYFCLI